ncbi:hypothetical protein PHYSODRAFT_324483 [Phytophthora sojae]|uniref:Uncharacterized protein n=1 Tax=Phytophthora sojae (strain P6497) TaxID=1094619 RepID=G4YYA3_PHYSP|nr:hypothetical protein PHYSODRAFT_324483 [Phytophthora sojae]EGZ23254.1 hypothetical protein PHYSODRAFT_324483 [Phytophthora sojae]|eukprot:XP_009518542.1 hypothetical protein PHYSODRAFT_324483 [Phytophthora sojae]
MECVIAAAAGDTLVAGDGQLAAVAGRLQAADPAVLADRQPALGGPGAGRLGPANVAEPGLVPVVVDREVDDDAAVLALGQLARAAQVQAQAVPQLHWARAHELVETQPHKQSPHAYHLHGGGRSWCQRCWGWDGRLGWDWGAVDGASRPRRPSSRLLCRTSSTLRGSIRFEAALLVVLLVALLGPARAQLGALVGCERRCSSCHHRPAAPRAHLCRGPRAHVALEWVRNARTGTPGMLKGRGDTVNDSLRKSGARVEKLVGRSRMGDKAPLRRYEGLLFIPMLLLVSESSVSGGDMLFYVCNEAGFELYLNHMRRLSLTALPSRRHKQQQRASLRSACGKSTSSLRSTFGNFGIMSSLSGSLSSESIKHFSYERERTSDWIDALYVTAQLTQSYERSVAAEREEKEMPRREIKEV